MLKGKRSVSACSLSSCRIRAEALARAFNNRIWPCVWLAQRSSSAERSDGMSNGIDDDEEFFDASPSPVEVEDESLFCQQHSSAATEAGRAKLYELLQQHAADDAIDVFYDVSEGAGLTDTASDTCLRDRVKESGQLDGVCQSPPCCRQFDDESYFSNNSENNEKDGEVVFSNDNQSSDEPVESELTDCLDSGLSGKCQGISPCSELSTTCSLTCEDCHDIAVQNGLKDTEENSDHLSKTENVVLEHNENAKEQEEQSLCVEHPDLEKSVTVAGKVLDETQEDIISSKTTTVNDLPSVGFNCTSPVTDREEKSLNGIGEQESEVPDPLTEDCHDSAVKNGLKDTEENSDHLSKIENVVLEHNEKAKEQEEPSLCVEHSDLEKSVTIAGKVLDETLEDIISSKTTNISDLPSVGFNCTSPVTDREEQSLNGIGEQESKVPGQLTEVGIKESDKETKFVVEIVKEIESPSGTSDSTDVKTPSPTSRLKVFDELRPKISRSTSLKTGKTPPGTPSKKKIVRFADVLGLDLEDVRHIMTGDIPVIPSSAYTDLNLKDTDLPASESISETLEVSRRDSSCWRSMHGATAMNALYPMFSIPGGQPDFMDRVRLQGICLETIIISEMNIQCTCKVMNYGYHKKVIARYTVNDWVSSNDIDASYILGSSNGETDSFAFSIFLSPHNRSVKFALKYEVNNKQYWDNNRNENYCISYHGNDPMQHLPSPSWHHQFW